MKMTNDLYEYFDITINENIISAGLDKVKDFRQSVLYTDNQFNAFCWSIYQSTNRLNSFQLGDLANKQGLESSHILTAIRKILKQYN